MKRVLIAVSLCAALALALSWSFPMTVQADGETPLGESMQLMKHHFRQLKARLGGAEAEGSHLEDIVAMQRAALTAKLEIPEKAAALEGEQQAAFVLRYRQTMIELEKQLLDLELAVLAGDAEAIEALVTELELGQERAHRKFKPRRR